ncbi:MAG: hypothetical protein AAGA62_00990 [Bacteroidota bacterium]
MQTSILFLARAQVPDKVLGAVKKHRLHPNERMEAAKQVLR